MKRKTVSPEPITGQESTGDLLRDKFPAYVGRNVREAFRLMRQAIEEDYFVFTTLSGAMTPAGMHHSCLRPLIERGYINSLTTTGANIYHDVHRSIGFEVEEIDPHLLGRLIGKGGESLRRLKAEADCRIVVADNGRMWIDGELDRILEVRNKLSEISERNNGGGN